MKLKKDNESKIGFCLNMPKLITYMISIIENKSPNPTKRVARKGLKFNVPEVRILLKSLKTQETSEKNSFIQAVRQQLNLNELFSEKLLLFSLITVARLNFSFPEFLALVGRFIAWNTEFHKSYY